MNRPPANTSRSIFVGSFIRNGSDTPKLASAWLALVRGAHAGRVRSPDQRQPSRSKLRGIGPIANETPDENTATGIGWWSIHPGIGRRRPGCARAPDGGAMERLRARIARAQGRQSVSGRSAHRRILEWNEGGLGRRFLRRRRRLPRALHARRRRRVAL